MADKLLTLRVLSEFKGKTITKHVCFIKRTECNRKLRTNNGDIQENSYISGDAQPLPGGLSMTTPNLVCVIGGRRSNTPATRTENMTLSA